jgi:predicted PurR-regulated permease PerM
MTAKPRPSSALFTLAAIVTAIAALHFAREILLPIALATLVSFLLAPLADRLERVGLGRIPSVLAVVTVAFAVLGLLGWVVTSQLVDLSLKLPQYRENIIAKVQSVTHGSETFKKVTDTLEDVGKAISEEPKTPSDPAKQDEATPNASQASDDPPANSEGGEVRVPTADEWVAGVERFLRSGDALRRNSSGRDEPQAVEVKVISLPPTPLSQVQGWLGPLMAPLTAAGMVVVLVIFMLLQREDQRNRLIRLFGTSNIHATTEAITDIVERVSKYLRMQFLINAGYGICVGVGLALLGLPIAVMFGVLSFSLRFLPYIGPWISAALPIGVSIAVSQGWTQVVLVITLFVVLELIVNNIAEPLLYGSTIGVSGLGIILAAIFWTWAWGAIGLVLAMPLTVCFVVMARYVPALRFITVLLGDQPTLTLAERIYQRMLALDDDEVREVADKYLASATVADFYDQVLVPALRLAEQDRHAGVLNGEQQLAVEETAGELVAELGAREIAKNRAEAVDASAANLDVGTAEAETIAVAIEPPRGRVLCIPLRDEGDKLVARMLGQLLEAERIESFVAAVESLTGELVESVESVGADLVVVSVLPPLPQQDSRLLCRRLRKRYPHLPIVVGFWDGSPTEAARPLLAAKGDGEIVTTLAAALERARAVASRLTDHGEKKAAAAISDRARLVAPLGLEAV